MKLHEARVLLTGASGGIGSAAAEALVRAGASVFLTGRDEEKLSSLAARLAERGRVTMLAADLTVAQQRQQIVSAAALWDGGVNVLINNAGTGSLQRFEHQSTENLADLLKLNLEAPMAICRELLPHLHCQGDAQILNIGSVFGSIGYPGFAAYSATKFGLRGFTEALRRELARSNVRVRYLAPRATQTGMNSSSTVALNAELRITVDPPERVAEAVCRMLIRGEHSAVIGWPEKLFARINSLWPGLVDRSLSAQLPVIERHAGASSCCHSQSSLPKPPVSRIV